MTDITIFKLASGEEIVAKVFDETETGFLIAQARLLAVQPVPGANKAVIGLHPIAWPLVVGHDADGFELAKKHILVLGNCPKELEDIYLQMTTGIDLSAGASPPKAKLIVGQ